ncbi:MAG: kynureninase, partial [Chitinophagaceae bacterium]|nr:kynureninase [Chitinophagaceae bacterium]
MKSNLNSFKTTREYACELDDADQVSKYRDHFIMPKHQNKEVIYLCGNSLGLQPKEAKKIIEDELQDWGEFGVEGHFLAKRPWFKYHHFFTESLTKIVGALPHEVVAMNTLTVNLHLLM